MRCRFGPASAACKDRRPGDPRRHLTVRSVGWPSAAGCLGVACRGFRALGPDRRARPRTRAQRLPRGVSRDRVLRWLRLPAQRARAHGRSVGGVPTAAPALRADPSDPRDGDRARQPTGRASALAGATSHQRHDEPPQRRRRAVAVSAIVWRDARAAGHVALRRVPLLRALQPARDGRHSLRRVGRRHAGSLPEGSRAAHACRLRALRSRARRERPDQVSTRRARARAGPRRAGVGCGCASHGSACLGRHRNHRRVQRRVLSRRPGRGDDDPLRIWWARDPRADSRPVRDDVRNRVAAR